MCRNIVPLFNLEPAVTEEEVQAAALQFVRKVSGYRQPSQANQVAFDRAVAEIAGSVRTLLNELVTAQSPRNSRRHGRQGAGTRTPALFLVIRLRLFDAQEVGDGHDHGADAQPDPQDVDAAVPLHGLDQKDHGQYGDHHAG